MKKKLIGLVFVLIMFWVPSISEAACSYCSAGNCVPCAVNAGGGTTYTYVSSTKHRRRKDCCCSGNTFISTQLSHSWNRSSASCTSAKKCTKCGYVAESAKGHYEGTAATCTKGTICGRCKKVYKNSGGLGHTGGTATCTVGKLCTRVNAGKVCGKEYTKSLGHTGGEETCTTGKLCTRVINGVVCGAEYTKPLGHNPNLTDPNAQRKIYTMKPSDYERNKDQHWKTCADCGEYVYEKEWHYGGEATYTSGPICEVCEEEYGRPLINKYSADKKYDEVNVPELVPGMVPVKFEGRVWITTTTDDPEWYNYNSSQNKWANVMLTDGMTYYEDGAEGKTVEVVGTVPSNKVVAKPGSMYVWVPRYTYKISGNDIVDYVWSQGTVDKEDEGYQKVPAFFYGEYLGGDVNENENYINRNGVEKELTGIWVSKFLASEKDGIIIFKPNETVDTSKTIGEAYVVSKDMMNVNYSEYGIVGNAESHMIKNTEWEAVSILTYLYETSPYNNSSNKMTGYAGGSKDSTSTTDIYAYDKVEGVKGSTTHNTSGIYDMSGIQQFVSGYLYGGNATNGKELTYIEEGIDVDKYLEEYTHPLLGKENDEVGTLTTQNAFVIRGGSYTEGNKSGIYGYVGGNGASGKGYRNVIIPINILEGRENISVLEAKDSIQEGHETIIELLINSAKSGTLGMSTSELVEALSIRFEQTSEDKKVYTEDINARIVSVNNNTTVNANTQIQEGINSIKIKIGGTRSNGQPVFRYIENARGKIKLADSFEIIGEDGNKFSIENIKLGTAEIDVIQQNLAQKTEIPITKISIEKEPYKMIADTTLAGGIIKVERANGSVEYVEMTSEDVKTSMDKNPVTIRYDDGDEIEEASEEITLNLYTSSEKTYVEVEGAEGSGTYDKGEEIKLYYHSEKGNKLVNWQTGNGNITSEYTFYTVPQTDTIVTANITTVEEIELVREPVKTEYLLGEKIDLRGGKLKVTFANGSVESVDMVCENVYVSTEGSFTTTGVNTIYVFYGDQNTSFDVNVR